MRIFFDTNVLISAYYFDGNEREVLSKIIDSKHTPVISMQVIEETKSVMNNKFGEKGENVRGFVERLLADTKLVDNHTMDIDVEDESDKNIIGSAVKADCSYLLTGDKTVQNCGSELEDIKIINAGEFLETDWE